MVTGLEILDSAIKIGLGAAIATIGSLLASKRQHDRELEKDRLRRRQDALEKIVGEFEDGYGRILSMHTDFCLYCRHFHHKREKERASVAKDLEKTIPPVIEIIQRYHGLEGRLTLYGFRQSAAALDRLRKALAASLKNIFPEEGANPPTEKEIDELFDHVVSERTKFYQALSAFTGFSASLDDTNTTSPARKTLSRSRFSKILHFLTS